MTRPSSWHLLSEYQRSDITEVAVHGAVAWANPTEIIYSWGGETICYGRSLMKPLQMKAVASELEALLARTSKAIACASHCAEPAQIKAAQAILPEAQWGLLQTPATQAEGSAGSGSPWNHPCSGKHAAILRACLQNGWSTHDYLSESHPYHQLVLREVRRTLGETWSPCTTAEDGCGLRTTSMSIGQLARLYAGIAARAAEDWIWDAMIEFPELVGGRGRLDSEIMKFSRCEILAKEGADGLLGLAVRNRQYPSGLGIVIKTAHGWDPPATRHLAHSVLFALGYELDRPAPPAKQNVIINKNILLPGLNTQSSKAP